MLSLTFVLRWLSSSLGITVGVHWVSSTVPKCWSVTCRTKEFPRDTEHSGHGQPQSVDQWGGEIVRWTEDSVWPPWYHNHRRARASVGSERWRSWFCRRGSTMVACMACMEKHWNFGDKPVRDCAAELCTITGISHGTCVDVSGTVCTHSLAVCRRWTPATVCDTAACSVRPCGSIVNAILCCTSQQ